MALFIPGRQRLIIAKEGTAGVLATTGGIVGPCSGISTMTEGTPAEEHAYLGLGVDMFSITPVARSASISFSELLRADALGMFGLFSMLGTGSDAKTGASDPYTHVGTVVAALPPTYSVYHDTGNATEYLTTAYATWATVSIDWAPQSAVTLSSTIAGLLPTVGGSPPTIATRTTADRSRPYDAVYTFMNGAGARYSAGVVSGNITFSRGTSPLVTSENASATDVVPGMLRMDGSFDMVYRGSGSGTVFADWLLWAEQGDSTHKSSIVWTPPDAHSISLQWYPMMFSAPPTIQDGGDGSLHISCSWTSFTKLVNANASSPLITAPYGVTVLNAVSTVMA